MKSGKPFDTVLFDLGNVLIQVDPAYFIRQISEASPLSKDSMIHYFTTSESVRNYEKGMLSSQKFYQLVSRDLNLTLSIRQFRILWESMFSPIEPMVNWVSTIRNQFQLMILSNTNAWHIDYCERTFDFMHWFHHRLYSHQLGMAKPDPEIFKKALATACTSPDNILFIDDMKENITAASDLGFQTIHFKGTLSFLKIWSGLNTGTKG